jgi:predicted PurR-regulated permease PerM
VRVELAPKSMIYAVLVAAAAFLLVRLFPVILVLVAALFLVGTLNPIVEWFEARGMARGWAIALVFTLFVLLILASAALTLPSLIAQVQQLADQEPSLREGVVDWLDRSPFGAPLGKALEGIDYGSIAKTVAASVLVFSTRLFEVFAYGVSSIFLALYMLIDRDRLRGALFALVPRAHHIRLARVLLNLETIVGGYIRGQLITSGLMTAFTFVLLLACGVEAAVALAVFAGLADVLPYIGVVLSIGPALLAAIARGPVVVAIVLAAMLAYEEFESRVLIPRIYGRALRLPSSLVLFSLLAGGTLMGIIGALLALPVAAVVLMLIDELRVELPGEAPPDASVRRRDERAEHEYEERAAGAPAEEASAIAVEISDERRAREQANEKRSGS